MQEKILSVSVRDMEMISAESMESSLANYVCMHTALTTFAAPPNYFISHI